MSSENYSAGVLPSLVDNRLLLEDSVTDRVSLFIEGLMLLLFLLSAIYAIIKNRSSETIADNVDQLKDVQSLLRHVAKQRKPPDFSDELDSAVCDPTTAEDESGR